MAAKPDSKKSKYDVALECPHCGAWSKSLKYRTSFTGVFLIIAASGDTEKFIACPSCVRKSILHNSLVNLLGFHVIFPLLFLIVELPQLINSFCAGHCPQVREAIDDSELTPEELQSKRKRKKKRETIIACIILLVFLAALITFILAMVNIR